MKVLSAKYSEDIKGYLSHYHDAHELLYVISGKISVNICGEEREAGAGSLLVFSRFEEHSVRVLTPEYRRYTLLISPVLARADDDYLLSSVLINRTGRFDHIITFDREQNLIETLMNQMAEEFAKQEPMSEKMLDSMLTRLLVLLYRKRPELFLTDENRNTEIVRELQAKFEKDYSEHFSLSELALGYHISESHLSHIFKSVTGYAPIEYLMSCRLSAAKNLLSSSDKSIKEIIDLCGFSDESNFSRTFKKKVGMTPTEFRKIT
ncbi:MAG: helix-turn-helix domain-containing protein [Clostridia bacterium]|nr:helix-turn-helix domain-containing protein [Clostridia bacterium]